MADIKLPNYKRFPLDCPDARKKYSGKKVAIKLHIAGELKLFLGEFVVHQFKPEGPQYISVHVNGRVSFDDPLDTSGWAFHLSEGHFASIVPVNDKKGEIEFLIQEPFRRGRIR